MTKRLHGDHNVNGVGGSKRSHIDDTGNIDSELLRAVEVDDVVNKANVRNSTIGDEAVAAAAAAAAAAARFTNLNDDDEDEDVSGHSMGGAGVRGHQEEEEDDDDEDDDEELDDLKKDPNVDLDGEDDDDDENKNPNEKPTTRRGRKPAPSTGTPEWKQQRKDSHKEVERRRRENINTAINKVAELLPVKESSKAAILSRAAEYIQKLKETENTNIEKWTLQKLLSEQQVSQLTSTNEKLEEELSNAFKEIEMLKNKLKSAGIEP
ncbi:HFL273Cp [Eremothecium sinecaudum]|uniref:HFL273Cp n=1 Tax=Eremothecium sinecaudum TaxID=45286 RepID=A0A109UZM2_9SACH|nr:HFL273Cp [Eremothecium sinecaudum]AMD21583.1 HFL273Cp [Eremothecium sinecaudum]